MEKDDEQVLVMLNPPQVKKIKKIAKDHPKFGLLLDAGIPDGVGGALVAIPKKWVRIHVGATTDFHEAMGVRAGLTLIPFRYKWFRVSLNGEIGHNDDFDANWLVNLRKKEKDKSYYNSINDIDYTYGNAHLGLEFGGDRVLFFIHAGASYAKGSLHNFEDDLNKDIEPGDDELPFESSTPELTYKGLTGKVGFLVFF